MIGRREEEREERQAMGRGARRAVATVAAVERSRAMMYSGERERARACVCVHSTM